MGRRDCILAVLQSLQHFYQTAKRGIAPPLVFQNAQHLEDDQFLWQAAIAAKIIDVELDDRCAITATTCGMQTQIDDSNQSFAFDPLPRLKDSGIRPCIVHFPGGGWRDVIDKWEGNFGR